MCTVTRSWCGRGDSNLWPLESEFPDTQRKAAVSSRFSSVVHKGENHIKSPRILFRSGFAGFFTRDGQMVVKMVNWARKKDVSRYWNIETRENHQNIGD